MTFNPYADRLAMFARRLSGLGLDAALVFGQSNRRSLIGVDCDNGCLVVEPGRRTVFYTDFRYSVMAARVAPWLLTRDMWRQSGEIATFRRLGRAWHRVGYEGSIDAARYLRIAAALPGVELVEISGEIAALRSVKTAGEIEKLRAAETLNDRVWAESRRRIRPGMTEKEIQRIIRARMNELGDGEAFETIVCAGANAAECHHVPDATVWRPDEPLLVDLGVRLDGFCSDMTRNIVPPRPSPLYKKIYRLVLRANRAAVAAVRPGRVCGDIDGVVRGMIADAGYGAAFGHSLGHGVGIDIHEAPAFAPRQKTVLRTWMLITVEPGIYLPGKFGVRIEDLVLVTDTGCEVLSASPCDLEQ